MRKAIGSSRSNSRLATSSTFATMHPFGSLTVGAYDLFMFGVADQDEAVVLSGVAAGFDVNLRNERARCIDDGEGLAFGALTTDLR